jgi:hypothetical protein
MKRSNYLNGKKPGNISIMAVGSLTVLLGFSAFVVDVGLLHVEKNRLQNAADAATSAAVVKLNGTQQGVDDARDVAARLVALNDPGQTMRFDKDSDVVFGLWDETRGVFDPDAPLTVWNSARVILARSPEKQNAIQPIFSQIFGLSALSVSASATAVQRSTYGDSSDTTGVIGGHFDVDTDHQIETLLPKNCKGSSCDERNTDGHVHEYDNRFNTAIYNARSPRNSSDSRSPGDLRSIQSDVGSNNFKIIIANADLSPGVDIIINGVRRSVKDYAALSFSSLPSFNSSTLTELKLEVRNESINEARIHRTQPDCAWSNMAGKNGEWRNGSLTIQAIKTSGTISSSVPKKGGQGVAATGLLHEIILFWHGPGSCYSSSQWDNEWLDIGSKTSHIIK